MDVHQNARLTFSFCGRETLANKIMIEKLTLKAAAVAFSWDGVGGEGRAYRPVLLTSRPLKNLRILAATALVTSASLRRQV
jgi:hypothetical protein